MKTTDYLKLFTVLIAGIFLGSTGFHSAMAVDTATVTASPIPAGDMLKVCIDKKTGTMRASNSCKKTERVHSLGGPGPRGTQGVVGPVGNTGPAITQIEEA